MLDFMQVSIRKNKNGTIEIYPTFLINLSKDLMTRGSDFYAIWDEEASLWSTLEDEALRLIDEELDKFKRTIIDYAGKLKKRQIIFDDIPFEYRHAVEVISNNSELPVIALHIRNGDSGIIDKWHKYVKNQKRDNFHPLDETLIFANTVVKKEDYSSKRLPYSLEQTSIDAYDEIIGTLYSPPERKKIEWCIGAILSGDSKTIQKFLVMYGPPRSGKSTILIIIQQLFEGYYSTFDSKALGSSSDSFALEAFRTNPLIAIQHDGDLSRIEDNTRLNSLTSHELMTVNEKFKSSYTTKFNTFLIMGTNKPVRITDAKSGIIRRLIDVSPTTTNKIPEDRYHELMSQIKFELGGIALHCLDVYNSDPTAYNSYVPTTMLGASNDFYNFIDYYYDDFKEEDCTTLQMVMNRYDSYRQKAGIEKGMHMRIVREELKSYFKYYYEKYDLGDGNFIRNYYIGFNVDKFNIYDDRDSSKKKEEKKIEWLDLKSIPSLFDEYCKDCPAQYGDNDEKPVTYWDNVQTTLKDISTKKLHYVRVPENHIVIDFDLKDETGKKSFEKNYAAARLWPKTYAELSKGGQGIHLHYIYDGDVKKLSAVYSEGIEVKVFTGKSSLRRRLTKCNDIDISTIRSGLPLRKENKVVKFDGIANEKALRTMIERHLNKEYGSTTVSINYIYNAFEDAYNSGMTYDLSSMMRKVISFAGRSTHNANYCLNKVKFMKFKSEDPYLENTEDYKEDDIIFFDIEVYPNVVIICYKKRGKDNKCVRLFNPTPEEVEQLGNFKLIGFNNRKYDNHICYGIILGDKAPEAFSRSRRIINEKDRDAFISAAYNWSYADVLDYITKKQSLKKYEIELGQHHLEMEFPWDQPLDKENWDTVADYCCNDVLATEAVFENRYSDFVARQILAELTGMTVNDTTNSLTTRLIVGKNKNPQGVFNWRDLSLPVQSLEPDMENFLRENFPEMMAEKFKCDGVHESLLPYFPGYTYDPFRKDKSIYKNLAVGEGGRVWAKPGMYANVITFDVASMHPHSLTSEYLFGPYTDNFNNLMEARIAIKHKDFEKAKKLFDGKLDKYLNDKDLAKALANALKLAINSVYGITDASFSNPLRDPKNIDNIVAKRGALFMIDLQEEVEKRGGEVIHIKTDSIKVVNPTPELQEFILSFGKRYGYTFEIEHKFEKICLVNNAVYIAKVSEDDEDWLDECKKAKENGEPEPTRWTATGAQFLQSFVFKTLFSHEPLNFKDFCEIKEVKTGTIYLDQNEDLGKDEHNYKFVGKVGEFVPIKEGYGAGELLSLNDRTGTYGAVTGTKGYRWLESEVVKNMDNYEDMVDKDYYIHLADQAKDDISKFGDFEWFVS